MLELKVHLGENEQVEKRGAGAWTFIVAQLEDTIAFYAEDRHKASKCRFVAEKHEIPEEAILGGATMGYAWGTLGFAYESINFGPVPKSLIAALEEQLKAALGEKHPLTELQIDMTSYNLTPDRRDRWQNLGYSFD